jgi:hypothetical protein
MRMFPLVSVKPRELFHATEADQKQAFEREKRNGLYRQLWRGKGKSSDENTWTSLEAWSDD